MYNTASVFFLLFTASAHPLPDSTHAKGSQLTSSLVSGSQSSLSSAISSEHPRELPSGIPTDFPSANFSGFPSFTANSSTNGTVSGFNYQNEKIRGVNLGGWLVLEPYITPSLFSTGWNQSNIPIDEYHFTKFLGKEKAQFILEKHWDEWIREEDFAKMAKYGLNFARIPVGYWAFIDRPGEPYVQGQVKYLDRAIGWAQKHGIKVWVDLHGVPGSQNGLDNSGQANVYQWMDRNTTNLHDTYLTLQTIIDRYGGPELQDTVIGIEPVNEPLPLKINITDIHAYYNRSYEMIREKSKTQGAIMQDGFEPFGYMNSWFEKKNGFHDVVIDHHLYQWDNYTELNMTTQEHVDQACGWGQSMKKNDSISHVVGEWSAAMTDCQKYLRGVYQGSMYDGTSNNNVSSPFGAVANNTKPLGSCSFADDITKWSNERRQDTRKFVEAQLDAYEYGGSGWVIWCYKTETSIEWDFSRLIEHGMFPNPVTERKYKNQCKF